jgi:hypothetical protein
MAVSRAKVLSVTDTLSVADAGGDAGWCSHAEGDGGSDSFTAVIDQIPLLDA